MYSFDFWFYSFPLSFIFLQVLRVPLGWENHLSWYFLNTESVVYVFITISKETIYLKQRYLRMWNIVIIRAQIYIYVNSPFFVVLYFLPTLTRREICFIRFCYLMRLLVSYIFFRYFVIDTFYIDIFLHIFTYINVLDSKLSEGSSGFKMIFIIFFS